MKSTLISFWKSNCVSRYWVERLIPSGELSVEIIMDFCILVDSSIAINCFFYLGCGESLTSLRSLKLLKLTHPFILRIIFGRVLLPLFISEANFIEQFRNIV